MKRAEQKIAYKTIITHSVRYKEKLIFRIEKYRTSYTPLLF